MSVTDLEFTAGEVRVNPLGTRTLSVEVDDVTVEDLLEQIDAKDAVEHYGDDTLLDLIGKQKAMEYFGLREEE